MKVYLLAENVTVKNRDGKKILWRIQDFNTKLNRYEKYEKKKMLDSKRLI